MPLFQELLQLAPGEWTASYNLAVACHDAGLATEGLATLRSALDSWPDNPDLLSLYASLSAEAGQLEAAIRALRAAIAAQPRNERHYVDLAALCLDHDALDLAMEVVSAGLANVSESAKLHTLSGAIHAERGELDQAMREFDEASRLSPSDLYGSVGLSLALRQADRLPEALSLLRRKLSERPRDATLNFLLADVLMRSEPAPGTREFHEARLALARAVRGKPNFAGAHAALGKLLLREGRGAEAVQELRTAAGLDGTDRVALNQLVLAYRQLGQEEAAAQAAGELRSLLQRQRVEEVARNRVRLARREADPQPR